MKFGYARVSTEEQNLDLQIDALIKIGVLEKNIVLDKVSGSTSVRPNFERLLNKLREGDELYVWKLDRMARSLIHLTKLLNEFKEEGIAFKSITEPFIDTTNKSPHSGFLINMFASLAEFERDLIRERTKAGLASARARGKVLGHPRGLSAKAKQKAILAEQYFKSGEMTVNEILERLNISRGTYYKYLRHQGVTGLRTYKKSK